MKPDSTKHNPSPDHLRGLLSKTGMTQEQVAKSLDVSVRAIQSHLTAVDAASYRVAPYLFQYALEQLAVDSTAT